MRKPENADIVLGVSYGDEAKGVTTQYLVKKAKENGRKPLVIRFGGGHQVGHTVGFISGDKLTTHTCTNFGSGVIQNVPVLMTADTIVYPVSAVNEAKKLREVEHINVRISFISEDAMITTPYDLAYNRAIEIVKGHGSVGVGINATVERDKIIPLRAYDFKSRIVFKQKLELIEKYYSNLMFEYDKKVFNAAISNTLGVPTYSIDSTDVKNVFMDFVDQYMFLTSIVPNDQMESRLNQFDHLVFEGHQGIMLDQEYGYNPYTTPSYTTMRNAIDFLQKYSPFIDISVYYVMRAYATRHGAGPFYGEDRRVKKELNSYEYENNVFNPYQKDFRYGFHSTEEFLYALHANEKYPNDVQSKNLVISCLDQTKNSIFVDGTKIHVKDWINEHEKLFDNFYGNYSPLSELNELTIS